MEERNHPFFIAIFEALMEANSKWKMEGHYSFIDHDQG